jgi:CrcB protein
MTRFLWVCFAGAIGTGARYLVGLWAGRTLGPAFPYGTLIVNLVGCFVLALVAQLAIEGSAISPTLRITLSTGFCGGLTTYSSFNLETSRLLEQRAWGSVTANLMGTLLGCFAAGIVGIAIARRLAMK